MANEKGVKGAAKQPKPRAPKASANSKVVAGHIAGRRHRPGFVRKSPK